MMMSRRFLDFLFHALFYQEILSHLSRRSGEDASWMFEFNSSVKRLESRVATCEAQVDARRTAVEDNLSKILKRLQELESSVAAADTTGE